MPEIVCPHCLSGISIAFLRRGEVDVKVFIPPNPFLHGVVALGVSYPRGVPTDVEDPTRPCP